MSSRDIYDLHPLLQPMATTFLTRCEAAGLDVRITCTYRSKTEQEMLYALGRTARSHVGPWDDKHPLGLIVTRARGGQSEHNFTLSGAPAALAFDIAVFVYGKPVWDGDSPLWQQAGSIAMALGLNWYGAPKAPFHELPHMAHPKSKEIMAGLIQV